MIVLNRPSVSNHEAEAAAKVILSGHLAQGKYVAELEKKFALLCGSKYAIAVNNGTAALHTALLAIGLKAGDEVITTPFTFIATANAVSMIGAKPVFADIDLETFNLDARTIEKLITKKTKAILVVNLYGQPATYTEIRKVARRHNLIIVEDAAQSVYATYKRRRSGNLADISCFSFYATKNIMSGEGGMITTNNKRYANFSQLIRNHGQGKEKKYDYKFLGYNYRMTDVLAAVAIEQLKKIRLFTKRRQLIARKYTKEIIKIRGLIPPIVGKNRSHVYHQYTIRVTSLYGKSRDELQTYLLEKGIQSTVYYPKPLYTFSYLREGKKLPQYVNTECAAAECLSIPINTNITDRQVAYIISVLQNI